MDQSRVLAKVFFWMFLGLLVSTVAAYLTYTNESFLISIVSGGTFGIILFAEIALVIILGRTMHKLSFPLAAGGFLLYSLLNGLTLSILFVIYQIGSIANVFIAVAVMFFIIGFYGYFTKKDLSKWGSILLMALIGIIVATIVNYFVGNNTFDLIINIIGIIVFVGLTAYDINKVKLMMQMYPGEENKIAIRGALTLYIDFINILLRLLSLFGKRK